MSRFVGLLALAALQACNQEPEPDEPWPRSCGVEGPVDLFEIPSNCFNVEIGTIAAAERVGDFYLFGCGTNLGSMRWWTVDRCGTQRTELPVQGDGSRVAASGTWITECVEPDGAVYAMDPRGLVPPRLVFESTDNCDLSAVGEGIAARSDAEGTVLFHPNPLDPTVAPRFVTDRASMTSPLDGSDPPTAWDTNGSSRRVLESMFIVVDDGSLVSYDPAADRLQTLDEGPVARVRRIDAQMLYVEPDEDDAFVLDLDSGRRIAFPKIGTGSAVQRLGDWLVQGGSGSSSGTDVVLRAVHLRSGEAFDVRGRDTWTPRAQLTDNTLIVDIGWDRAIVWPSSGWTQAVDLPGDAIWSSPLGDGVFSYSTWEEAPGLFFVPNADEPVVPLAAEARQVYPMRSGHIVYQPWPHPGDPPPLLVRMPDGTTVQLEASARGSAGYHQSMSWPVDGDELVYVVPTADGGFMVRGTRLP